MENITNMGKSLKLVGIATLAILSIPFIAMQFTAEVNWTLFDFFVAAIVLFTAGAGFVFMTSNYKGILFKLAIAFSIGITLFMVWVDLAVGIIGSGPHLGNWLYGATVAIVIGGFLTSRFDIKGLEKTMYIAAGSIVIIAAIALGLDMDNYPGSSIGEIGGVNGMFFILYLLSGLCYKMIGQKKIE